MYSYSGNGSATLVLPFLTHSQLFHHPSNHQSRRLLPYICAIMNKFGFAKFGNKKSRENRGIGYNKTIEDSTYNKTIERSTGDSSVNTGSSYGSASSGRSASSSLGMASTFASLERLMPTTAQPQIPVRGPRTLRLPCHLNCQCDACTKPNSDFLDGLLQLSPKTLATPSTSSPLAGLAGHMGDFSLDD